MKNIVVIFGTSSLEHNVSLNTGLKISTALKEINKYNLFFIGITKNNIWKYSDDINNIIITQENKKYLINEDCKNIFKIENGKINNIKIDCAFLATLGKIGEDGYIQALLKMHNIPFTGSEILGSSVCFNKNISKYIAMALNINVVPFILIKKEDYNQNTLLKEIEHLGNDFVIKINSGGSSIGVFLANKKDIFEKIKEAFKLDNIILIEKYINNVEYSFGILEKNKKLEYDLILETKLNSNIKDIYTYEYKYINGSVGTSIANNINENIKKEIINNSIKLFKCLNLKDYARIDFFLCKDTNKIYFNEINTLPGFTQYEFFTRCFKNKYSFKELIEIIINNNIENTIPVEKLNTNTENNIPLETLNTNTENNVPIEKSNSNYNRNIIMRNIKRF
jgi:D-alanine-D-alanine ligase